MILETIDLTKTFGGLTAVDAVDMRVQEQEIRAIIGPNGSGKSTLLNCISGVYKPTSGVIKLKGEPVGGLAPYALTRMGIGRTFQNIRMFNNLTVLQNVMVGRHCRSRYTLMEDILGLPRYRKEEAEMREKAREYLGLVGMADKQEMLPGSLSYGQRRMVEVARALATEPSLLLLDEPAAGLSQAEAADLAKEIRRIRDAGITIILVEHNMRFVMNISDQITALHFGKKIAEGTPDECRANAAVIECYLGGQVGGRA
jgi:branched-chain amino acid transport system ATP-binding protein